MQLIQKRQHTNLSVYMVKENEYFTRITDILISESVVPDIGIGIAPQKIKYQLGSSLHADAYIQINNHSFPLLTVCS